MKRLAIFAAVVMAVSVLSSCNHKDNDEHSYLDFVGIWGVERIDYYNIDYAGNPIEGSRETYYFTPGDMEGGIDLVFRSDKTGEMRDRSTDTIINKLDTDPVTYDTIICPDTTLYTYFDYSFDADDAILYMNMETAHTYKMKITHLDEHTYTYVNEYRENYVEEAKMVRTSDEAKAVAGPKSTRRPHKSGSIFGNR